MFAKLHEKLKGYKTVVANAMVGLPAALYSVYVLVGPADLTPAIPAQYVAWFIVGWSLLGVILRVITTGPVGSKGDSAPAPQTKAGD